MIYCIVAVELRNGIGFNGSMPWPSLSNDLKWFKDCTTNNVVIMGSTTWKGFKSPLSNRINVVISKNNYLFADITTDDPVSAIQTAKHLYPEKDIYIIGGQKLYDSTKDLVDVYYITEINGEYTCDTYFNKKYVDDNFKNVETIHHYKSDNKIPEFTIKKYTK